MKPIRRKLSRKNRNLVTGLLIGAASLAFVVYLLEIPRGELLNFFLLSLLFLFIIIVLAVVSIVVFKTLGRLLGKFR